MFLFCAAFLTIYDCEDFEKLIQTTDDRICTFKRGTKFQFSKSILQLPIVLDFIAFALLIGMTSVGLAFFSYYNCIMGIKEVRSHHYGTAIGTFKVIYTNITLFQANFMRINPFMQFLAVFTICSMYDFVYPTMQGILFALIKGTINGYLFFVVYSHYITLRDGLPQYKPASRN